MKPRGTSVGEKAGGGIFYVLQKTHALKKLPLAKNNLLV